MKDFLGDFKIRSLSETKKHAELVSQKAKAPLAIFLKGDLGAGKTQWVKFFVAKFLKDAKINVTSPSYSLVNEYSKKNKTVTHMDLYRIRSLDDLESTGFWDFVGSKTIFCVEWDEIVPREQMKDVPTLRIQIKLLTDGTRDLSCFWG